MSGPVVATSGGRLRGIERHGVAVFRGVPYAAADRFAPPRPAAPWPGVRSAESFGPYCPQNVAAPMWHDPIFGDYFTGGRAQELIDADVQSDEDCLVLNVLRPIDGVARPVLFSIHGGGFHGMCGSIATLADRLVREQDVVLISVNHRIGPLGFLYLGGLSPRYRTGNVGLLDLIEALRWVRDNAAAFGGDPGNVTLVGESGGGSKILDLMAMPLAKSLFHKAILDCPGWPDPQSAACATDTARRVLRRLDVDVAALGRLPVKELLAGFAAEGITRFAPVADGPTVTRPLWIDTAPPGSAHVPVLVGNSRDEMTYQLHDPALLRLEPAALRPQLAAWTGLPTNQLDPVIATFAEHRPGAGGTELFVAIMSGRLQEIGLRVAQLQARVQPLVYRYEMHHAPAMPLRHLGAFHTAALPLALRLVRDPADEPVSQALAAAWAGFARTGAPGHSGLPDWPPYSADRATMTFDRSATLVHDPRPAERIAMGGLPRLGAC